jgi:inosine/xanthosine triphosphate pyrophosphatase family protein
MEVEIAADAIRELWQSDRNQQAIRETGHGASFLAMAIVALEAAAKARGKTAVASDNGMRVH